VKKEPEPKRKKEAHIGKGTPEGQRDTLIRLPGVSGVLAVHLRDARFAPAFELS